MHPELDRGRDLLDQDGNFHGALYTVWAAQRGYRAGVVLERGMAQ